MKKLSARVPRMTLQALTGKLYAVIYTLRLGIYNGPCFLVSLYLYVELCPLEKETVLGANSKSQRTLIPFLPDSEAFDSPVNV